MTSSRLCPLTSIFVDDIIEAVPIDKYFELFKPNLLGGGGFIRICMNFVKDLSELQQQPDYTRMPSGKECGTLPSTPELTPDLTRHWVVASASWA
eukprot:1159266-Pelagomonas_calceolata.AAC.5